MSPAVVDWLPAATMLVSGLIVGGMLIWHVRKSSSAVDPAGDGLPLAVRDLLGRRDSLVVQLRELEDASAKRSPQQLEEERRELELEAAEVLRAIDLRRGIEPLVSSVPPAHQSSAQPTERSTKADRAASAASVPPPAGSMRGFLWGVGSTAAIALLLFFVGRSVTDRKQGDSMTGKSVAGGQPMQGAPQGGPPFSAGGRSQPTASDSRVTELEAAIAARPDNIDLRLELARLQLERQQPMEVFTQTQKVLERDPKNPRALAYQALVKLQMGRGDEAVSMLRQAIAADPNLLEASVYLAIVYTELGRSREAADAVHDAVKRHPEQAERLNGLLAEIQARQSMVAEAPPAPAFASSNGTAAISGTVDLDPAARSSVAGGSVLFIIVRATGVTAGPPVAAKRITQPSFPVTFSIGQADSMMGQPIPANVRIEARVDSDGNPLTRGASEPSTVMEGVAAGTSGIKLTLK